MWQLSINNDPLRLNLTEELFEDKNEDKSVFMTVCSGVTDEAPKHKMQTLPNKLHKFKDVFFPCKADMLFQYSIDNHSIILKKNKESPFDSLYNLFEKELHVLRDYIE